MAGLDTTIANVALPSIQRTLHASVSGLQWTIDAYTLVIACLLMFSGSLADRFGRRRVFQIVLATLGGFLFLNTLYLQDVRGYSALRAGLLTIPMPAALAVFSNISGRLVAGRGLRPALIAAGGLIAVSTGLLVAVGAHAPVWYLIIVYVLYGAGMGLVGAPITSTALSGMPRDQAGVAGAIASTCRQTGGAIGVAVTGAIIAADSGGFVHAGRTAWAVLAGCGVAVVLLGTVSTGRWALATAQRSGALLATDTSPARKEPDEK